jgi:(1->4)-alpha-D-glucan 1-alpha-D-glucosylmutase
MDAIDDLFRVALERAERLRRLPESTYRVQFHKGFTFRDAAAIAPYLAELGVTHLYASPYLKAVPGSTHGYDVVDHNRLNPEVGTEEDYAVFLEALRANGLAHVLDTVPNHVGVATNENGWWNDVLENGRASRYADYFDIAWRGSTRPQLHDKVLLPLLGGLYGDVLEKGELKLVREDGKVWVRYYQRRFPINRQTLQGVGDVEALNGTPGDPRSFDRLDDLLNRQHYRLAYWRVAPDEINYRRFFDVNDLAAISMEREEVFEAAHALTLRLLAEGKVAGLRIDHPDGLYDPKAYFDRLQAHFLLACARAELKRGQEWEALRPALLGRIERHLRDTPREDLPLYVVAEKILAIDEPLPERWACHGTSGYDFLIMANSLFVDAANEEAFSRVYQEVAGEAEPFEELVYEKKRLILRISLASELHMLAHRLDRLAQKHRGWRDFTLSGLTGALREVIACFPVYRSYVSEADGVNDVDRQRIEAAVEEAVRRNPRTEPAVFHFIRDALLQRYPETFGPEEKAEQLAFAGKFQQLTSPATAKGIEDTAFYVYNRLVSLNEVGGEPRRFGVEPEAVHRYLAERQSLWPHALSAMSTHDTKRSEDVRARLNVLSEMPDEWAARVKRWFGLNARLRRNLHGAAAPHPNDEYLFYQTLVGAWPLEPAAAGEAEAFVERVQAYLRKAMREAKVRTRWTDPDEPYENAVLAFAADVMRSPKFLQDFRPFHARVSHIGLLNSLSQTLLRLTAPGVPDTYQGCELWDFSLVDPDNRRPVDYQRRIRMLRELGTDVADLLRSMPDGRIKLFVTRAVLRLRRDLPGLFSTGEYLSLCADNAHPQHVFAFERRLANHRAIIAVPRLIAALVPRDGDLPLGPDTWHDTRLPVTGHFRNLFTGEHLRPDSSLPAAQLFATFPVALLVSA